MTSPELHLRTLYVLDDHGRIVSTREPGGGSGPLFEISRGMTSIAWAVRADVPADIAAELDRIARTERPTSDFRQPPAHAQQYASLLARLGHELQTSCGPAFTFPEVLPDSADVVLVDDEHLLGAHFSGWVVGEIAAGRAPMMAVVEDGTPVSICFCARSSDIAAEAGLETASAHRGRGLAARVTAAWATAIRASGRTPLYTTSWTNLASLVVARKLGLVAYAGDWSLSD